MGTSDEPKEGKTVAVPLAETEVVALDWRRMTEAFDPEAVTFTLDVFAQNVDSLPPNNSERVESELARMLSVLISIDVGPPGNPPNGSGDQLEDNADQAAAAPLYVLAEDTPIGALKCPAANNVCVEASHTKAVTGPSKPCPRATRVDDCVLNAPILFIGIVVPFSNAMTCVKFPPK